MARLVIVLATLLALPIWLGAAPPVLACTGLDATLADGLRHADAVYYARITAQEDTGAGFHTLTLDVGTTVRGDAQQRVTQTVSAKVCTGLEPGQRGLVVLGAKNAFDGDGSGATYNLFYVFGPGYYARAEAGALLGAPPTDTADVAEMHGTMNGFDLGWVGSMAFLAVSVLLGLRGRRTANEPVRKSAFVTGHHPPDEDRTHNAAMVTPSVTILEAQPMAVDRGRCPTSAAPCVSGPP
jgi:hypothetical protein